MATYNGELYLLEQLESILNQTLKPEKIFIVDDCSSDRTLEILADVKKHSEIPIEISVNNCNIGVIKTFEKALALCNSKYIALADQDDVWLPQKLEFMLQKAKSLSEGNCVKPLLLHCNLKVVDKELTSLNVLQKDFWLSDKYDLSSPLSILIERNYVPGCTMIINDALRNLALPIPLEVSMHDYWLMVLCAASGKIAYCEDSLMLYRRHESNVSELREYKKGYFGNYIYLLFYIPRILFLCGKVIAGKYNQSFIENQIKLFDLVNERIDGTSEVIRDYLKTLQKGGFKAVLFFNTASLQLKYKRSFYLILISRWFKNLFRKF